MEQSDEEKNFCTNMRSLRLLHKLSQKEMAKALGIGLKSLRKIEAGEIPPRLSTDVLFAIHNRFGIRISNLFKPMLGLEKELNL